MRKNFLLVILALSSLFYVEAQVGINTQDPTETLDVNGSARIRELPVALGLSDKIIVADSDGVLKRSLFGIKGIMRGYLSQNFSSPASSDSIYRITSWDVIDNPNVDFNSSTGVFVAPITGLYKVTISITLLDNVASPNTSANFAFGFVDDVVDKWVSVFSLPTSYVTVLDTGNAASFSRVIRLTSGGSYYFACSGGATLLSITSGNTGSGIGSFFEIQLIGD